MVVYRSIPTSNRNALAQLGPVHNVVYRSIPTSNRNQCRLYQFYTELYIVLFLHQTATNPATGVRDDRCISFYSYIKPQPRRYPRLSPHVVYRSIPTSNRN